MSEHITLEAENRVSVGKRVKQLRREGLVPAVIYGLQDPVTIQVESLALRKALRVAGTANLIDVRFGDQTRTVLAREVQRHVTRGDVLHVDFLEVDLTQSVGAVAALVTFNESPLTASGIGSTTQLLYSVNVEGLPEALVSEFEVDLSQILDAEDVIRIGDLDLPAGLIITDDSDEVIVKFDFTREDEEEEEEGEDVEAFFEGEDADVEVVGRGRSDDEDFDD